MTNQATDLLSAEHRDHFLAPLLVQVQQALLQHGLTGSFRVELSVTAGDDSSVQMTLEQSEDEVRILPAEISSPFYSSGS